MSELSDKALTAIQDAVKAEIITDKAGNEYVTKTVTLLKERTLPSHAVIDVSTLTGLVDYCKLKENLTGDEKPFFIHVEDEQSVKLYSDVFGLAKQQTCFLTASFDALLGKSFRFGEFYDHESFIIGLQSLFEPTPQRAEVLKVIGTIKENQVREFGDDGVTQAVSAKAGIALVTDVPVPNPVYLKPFRTFREIDQPESPFILRVKSGKEKPTCALIEADGGKWKLTAIQRIKEFLEDKLELPIIA